MTWKLPLFFFALVLNENAAVKAIFVIKIENWIDIACEIWKIVLDSSRFNREWLLVSILLKAWFRFLAEITSAGILSEKDGLNVLSSFLTNILSAENSQASTDVISFAISFVTFSGEDFVGIVPKQTKRYEEKFKDMKFPLCTVSLLVYFLLPAPKLWKCEKHKELKEKDSDIFPHIAGSSILWFNKGFTRLSMKTKYICRGLMSPLVNFCDNRAMWTTILHVKVRMLGKIFVVYQSILDWIHLSSLSRIKRFLGAKVATNDS